MAGKQKPVTSFLKDEAPDEGRLTEADILKRLQREGVVDQGAKFDKDVPKTLHTFNTEGAKRDVQDLAKKAKSFLFGEEPAK